MSPGFLHRVRSVVVDQIDGVVLRRMSTLLDRSSRGVGRRADDVNRVLRGINVREADDAFVGSIAQLWHRATSQGGSMPDDPSLEEAVIDQFHRLYYRRRKRTWQNTSYRGVKIVKCPLDLWIYQELLHELQPDLIIETGTAYGGSALFLCDLCDVVGKGEVITIDIGDRLEVTHPRLTAITGSSVDPSVVATVQARASAADVVLVILDSDHSEVHVAQELRMLSDLVTPGSYVVVEDSNVNGNPVYPEFGPGPAEAIETFLREDTRFRADRSREKFMLTFNPGGFLQRVE